MIEIPISPQSSPTVSSVCAFLSCATHPPIAQKMHFPQFAPNFGKFLSQIINAPTCIKLLMIGSVSHLTCTLQPLCTISLLRKGIKKLFFWETFPKSVYPPTHPRVFVRFGKTKGEIWVEKGDFRGDLGGF